MIRFLTGLETGLVLAYLTAPQTGKEIRYKLVNLTDGKLRDLRLLSQQGTKTVGRAKQAWEQIKTTTVFWSPSPKP